MLKAILKIIATVILVLIWFPIAGWFWSLSDYYAIPGFVAKILALVWTLFMLFVRSVVHTIIDPDGTDSSTSSGTAGTYTYTPGASKLHKTTDEFDRRDANEQLDQPSNQTDDSYGISDKQLFYLLHHCAATVRGIPGGGLNDSDFGMARVKSGQRGEMSVAKALLHYGILDNPNNRVWFSAHNPGDETGNTDIDIILAFGNQVWLIDAKHYAPDSQGETLGAPNLDSAYDKAPWELRMSGGKTYRASRNMSWAADSLRLELPVSASLHSVVLLTRTAKGVPGTQRGTRWPGDVHARNIDNWMCEIGDNNPFYGRPVGERIIPVLDRLVKNKNWVQRPAGYRDIVEVGKFEQHKSDKSSRKPKFVSVPVTSQPVVSQPVASTSAASAPVAIEPAVPPTPLNAVLIGSLPAAGLLKRIHPECEWQKPVATIDDFWNLDADTDVIAISSEFYETAVRDNDERKKTDFIEFVLLSSQSSHTIIVSDKPGKREQIETDLFDYAALHMEKYSTREWIEPITCLQTVIAPMLCQYADERKKQESRN